MRGLVKVTSYGEAPDIRFVVFAGDRLFSAGVDEAGVSEIAADRPVLVSPQCRSPVQVVRGAATGSLVFAAVETATGALMSLWQATAAD